MSGTLKISLCFNQPVLSHPRVQASVEVPIASTGQGKWYVGKQYNKTLVM